MVRTGEQEQEGYRSKLFNFRGMFESTGRHTKSLSVDTASALDPTEDGSASSRSQGSKPLNDVDQKVPKARVISKEEIAAKEAKEKLLQGEEHYLPMRLRASLVKIVIMVEVKKKKKEARDTFFQKLIFPSFGWKGILTKRAIYSTVL